MPVLTARSVEQAKPQPTTKGKHVGELARTEIVDEKVQGLRLVIQLSGVKSWAVRYSFARRKRKITIGPFPRIGLAAARERAASIIEQVDRGIDPALAKTRGVATDESFEAHADLYDKLHVSTLRPATAAYVRRELDAAKVAWRGRALVSITKQDVVALLDAVKPNGKHAENTRRKVLASFFNWSSDRAAIDVAPTSGLKKNKVKKRERFLDDAELKLVWAGAEKVNGKYGALVKLLILTGCRRNEIARLEWSEVKADCIMLPPERTKTDEAFRIALTPAMRKILDTFPRTGKYVLTRNGNPLSANDRAKNLIDVKLDQPWRFHDLRRSFRTGLARIGVPVQVAEKCLNHKLAGILAIYDQHDYADEMKAAWEKWSTHIEALTTTL